MTSVFVFVLLRFYKKRTERADDVLFDIYETREQALDSFLLLLEKELRPGHIKKYIIHDAMYDMEHYGRVSISDLQANFVIKEKKIN